MYFARSARSNLPVQPYEAHVRGVMIRARRYAENTAQFSNKFGPLLRYILGMAAPYHDLGKLAPENQNVLSGAVKADHLISHWDAGVAYILALTGIPLKLRYEAALLIYAHHSGLPSWSEERQRLPRGKGFLRMCQGHPSGITVKEYSDKHYLEFVRIHQSIVSDEAEGRGAEWLPTNPLFERIALSCLVDADHTNASRHPDDDYQDEEIPLLPEERLALLDNYVSTLGAEESAKKKRNQLRQAVYNACRNAGPAPNGMIACDSPVGTGKTTAVMAHLLNVAQIKGLRRIFVVLPFTNIIDQSVDVYRNAIVLKDEDREKVVAAHHHRAEFESEDARAFSFLWNAPITVTTAVQFFETLASNHPATLRKLHQLAGSAIFLDEAHAALPAHLWPQAWKWLNELVKNWGCYIVLASGSLTRFWELPEFANPPLKKEQMPELVSQEVRNNAKDAEAVRVSYEPINEPLTIMELCDWISSLPGPRLVILNTVHSAAAVANELKKQQGRNGVEHISTALAPIHREATIKQIKKRLADDNDINWTLVATSCVEAGMNFSFKTAAREMCSLVSTIQTAGRINRSGERGESVLWNFKIVKRDLLIRHPAFQLSASILESLFKENMVSPDNCKEAMKREIRRNNYANADDDEIVKMEVLKEFPSVNEMFRVISTASVTAVVNKDLVARLQHADQRKMVKQSELQRYSVNIYPTKIKSYALKPIYGFRKELYEWDLDYDDDFLGYMAGVLKLTPDPNNFYF